MDVTKPYKFIWFGDVHGPNPYKFIGFRWAFISQTPLSRRLYFFIVAETHRSEIDRNRFVLVCRHLASSGFLTRDCIGGDAPFFRSMLAIPWSVAKISVGRP
jgi:hypothetical protein